MSKPDSRFTVEQIFWFLEKIHLVFRDHAYPLLIFVRGAVDHGGVIVSYVSFAHYYFIGDNPLPHIRAVSGMICIYLAITCT